MRSLFLALLLTATVTARGALNLSPFPSELEDQGIKYTQLSFKDDKRQVVYNPPLNWTWRGGSSQLRLTPPATFKRADGIVETSPLAEPQPLDEKAIAILRQQFLSTLPPGSQGVKMLSEELGPVMLGGNIQTFEFTASYQVAGESFVRSCLVANLPDTQLRFKLTALKKDFDNLHRLFRSSLISWQWIEPPAAKTAMQNQPQTSVAR